MHSFQRLSAKMFTKMHSDVPDTGYISDIRHYPALFEVSGIRPDSTSLSDGIPDIFKVQENCVE